MESLQFETKSLMSETSDSGMETFFFALYSIFIFSSGNIEHVALVNDLLIIRRETNFFFGEQVITQSQKS